MLVISSNTNQHILHRISVVEDERNSYTPQGIDVGIDLESPALSGGKRLNNCQAIVSVVIEW